MSILAFLFALLSATSPLWSAPPSTFTAVGADGAPVAGALVSDLAGQTRFASTYEVRGRVTGPDGEPVPGASVALVLANSRATQVLAEEDGSFSISVENGVYAVTAIADGFERVEARDPVEVRGGPVDGVEIALRPGAVLTGRFPGLKPGEEPTVYIEGTELPSLFDTPGGADPEGGYRLTNLGAGEWTIRAVLRMPEAAPLERLARGTVIIPEGATEARLDLDFHLGDLTLTIRFTEPVDYVRVNLRLPDGSSVVSNYDSPRDGRVRVPRLRAGDYHLELLGDAGSILLDQPVELTSDLEIVVKSPPEDEPETSLDRSAKLHGCLPGLRPGERERVGLWVQTRGIERAFLDSKGCFRLDGLAPGELTAEANLRDTSNVYRDRKAIGKLSVRPGEDALLDIDFHMGDQTLSGRVTASHPPKVFATLLLPDGTELITDGRQLAEGRFHFDRLREGTYRLRIVDFGGKIVADQPVEVPAGREVVIELP